MLQINHRFIDAPQFSMEFPRRIDLRWAIVLPRGLDYPDSVEKALRKHRCKHVLNEERRCAAFALGTRSEDSRGVVWYILTMQSDLAFSDSARLRDYIRGWRVLLFRSILQDAQSNGVGSLALISARCAARAALWWKCRESIEPPVSWVNIYDRTAHEHRMTVERSPAPINIQVMPKRRRVLSEEFYYKRLVP